MIRSYCVFLSVAGRLPCRCAWTFAVIHVHQQQQHNEKHVFCLFNPGFGRTFVLASVLQEMFVLLVGF